ncbi:MAG TPA: tetratricopeptide repeat protein, partial [bacterium]
SLAPSTPSRPAPVEAAAPASTATLPATPIPTVIPYSIPSPTPTETLFTLDSAPVTTLAGVKKYYRLGMNAFMIRNYPLSLKYLRKSLASKEVHGASYYYAETYATIGVIYQFHAPKIKDHDQKALINYKKALAIDPTTKSAKHYYKRLKAKVAKASKAKAKPKRKTKPKPTPLDDSGMSSSMGSTTTAGY